MGVGPIVPESADTFAADPAFTSRYGLPNEVLQDRGGIAMYDTFTRSDAATLPGAPESGGAYVVRSGTWGITSNKLKLQVASSSPAVLTYNAGEADAVIQAVFDLSADNPQIGFALRVTDENNMLMVKVYPPGIRLFKRVAGTETQLAVLNSTSNTGKRRWLRAVVVGAVVTVIDLATGLTVGAHTLTGGDETTFAAQTEFGVFEVASAAGRISTTEDLVVRLPL